MAVIINVQKRIGEVKEIINLINTQILINI